MVKRICIFAGSFNPPGRHHVEIAAALARRFDELRIVTCGFRPDKPSNNALAPALRAVLIDLGFQGLPRVVVDHFDLENDCFTFSDELERRFAAPDREVWHAITAELVRGGARGESAIQKTWVHGALVWKELRFAVYRTPEMPLDPADLPPHAEVIETPVWGSSLEIRRKLYEGDDCRGQLPPRVLEYINRYGLFKFGAVAHEGRIKLAGSRLLIVADDRNPNAVRLRERLGVASCETDPDAVLVIGGDGTMLAAIQNHWRLRRPMVGLNAGHLGFLMNEAESLLTGGGGGLCQELVVRRLPMLHVEFARDEGPPVEALTFNDAWIERSSGQTAWLRIAVNDEVKLEKAVCDGVLVSTAAGSTAYAMSMGASPLLADSPAWLLVGSNVMRPLGWKSALLPLDASVRVEGLDIGKRPLNGYVFGQMVPGVVGMTARISRVATVELAYSPAHDMARKISDLQFGQAKSF
ncbi:MAG: NAD(+)/NADH kinase [Pirellulaceae bacterium]|nr:NAD(+)/NADH kinase [Pirellulaceae bacterium]